LCVVVELLDHATAHVDVVHRRNAAHAFTQVLGTRRRLEHLLEECAGKEVVERIDVTHAGSVRGDVLRQHRQRGFPLSTLRGNA
jgi:hypothetical protein